MLEVRTVTLYSIVSDASEPWAHQCDSVLQPLWKAG